MSNEKITNRISFGIVLMIDEEYFNLPFSSLSLIVNIIIVNICFFKEILNK